MGWLLSVWRTDWFGPGAPSSRTRYTKLPKTGDIPRYICVIGRYLVPAYLCNDAIPDFASFVYFFTFYYEIIKSIMFLLRYSLFINKNRMLFEYNLSKLSEL